MFKNMEANVKKLKIIKNEKKTKVKDTPQT
jgi:hypothetical protein